MNSILSNAFNIDNITNIALGVQYKYTQEGLP